MNPKDKARAHAPLKTSPAERAEWRKGWHSPPDSRVEYMAPKVLDDIDTLLLRVTVQKEAVIDYINAMGPHMEEAWKEGFIEAFDLEVDKGNPYQPVRAKKA